MNGARNTPRPQRSEGSICSAPFQGLLQKLGWEVGGGRTRFKIAFCKLLGRLLATEHVILEMS